MPSDTLGHDAAQHLDPELLAGWRTWLHLTIQWAHLVAFALWLGLTTGTLLLGMKLSLDALLYSSWILFLISLATGTYNMEWSAGISETPSLFLLLLLQKIPYGVTYAVVLAAKVTLYVLAILLTLVTTIFHLRHRMAEARLRRMFLLLGSTLAVLLTLAASVVLFYHEVADLWPTRIHSLGGVTGPEGPRGQITLGQDVSPPNDFELLLTSDPWIDIGLRTVHLLGFALLSGGMLVAAAFGNVNPKRFLWYAWTLLVIQILSGIGSMERWTPFYVSPYIWNLSHLSEIRFGRSYALFMATKHALVIGLIGLMLVSTLQYVQAGRDGQEQETLSLRRHLAVGAVLGVAIAYIMVIVLLLHEGVDHAL